MAHFTTDLPDWKTWRNLNENKELAEDKAIELYKKLLLAQTVMIEESLRQINTHNEALINAQGGSAGAGAGAGGGGTNAKILNVTNFIGVDGAGSTGVEAAESECASSLSEATGDIARAAAASSRAFGRV